MGYFDEFPNQPEVSGIPRIKMNRPIAPEVVVGDVGLELEIEGVGLPAFPPVSCPATGAAWTGHRDGSLRGESLEYVFSRPASVSGAETLVKALYKAFKDEGTTLRLSNRCSTHVHLNVSDWKVNHLSSFLALWTALEPALIDYNGLERKTNHFCLGVENTTATVEAWLDFLRDGVRDFGRGLKYSALNILHLFDFGSFEVRCGAAWSDPDEVINWTKFLWSLRCLVLEKFDNPRNVAEYVSGTPVSEIIRDVATRAGIPEFADRILEAGEDVDQRGFDSFRNAQPICYAFPWDLWLPQINAPYIPQPFGEAKKAKTGLRVPAPPPPLDALERAARDRALWERGFIEAEAARLRDAVAVAQRN